MTCTPVGDAVAAQTPRYGARIDCACVRHEAYGEGGNRGDDLTKRRCETIHQKIGFKSRWRLLRAWTMGVLKSRPAFADERVPVKATHLLHAP